MSVGAGIPDAGELARLERLAVDLALGAGALVARRPEDLVVDTKSSETDVVTVMDARSEEYLRGRLRTERPDDGVLGEERGARAGSSDLTWVLDPIDGTVNYLYGSGEYAVSVAVVVGDPQRDGAWTPVAGAVAQPAAGRVFHAHRGGGARLSVGAGPGRMLRVAGADRPAVALLATGFGYDAQVRRDQASVMLQVLPQVRDIRRGGSAALDLCAVAAGTVDAYYEKGVNVWDIAAGVLIAAEAGALVTGVGADDPGATGVLAAPPGLHPHLLEVLARARGVSL